MSQSPPPAHRPSSKSTKPSSNSKKRKAAASQPTTSPQPDTAPHPPAKRPRQKKHRRPDADDEDALLDLDAGVNTAFGRMDPDLLADHVAARTKRFGTDLSPVELADLYVPAHAIRDTTTFAGPRAADGLPAFLEAFAAGPNDDDDDAAEKERRWLGSAPRKCGSPHTVVVTGAGLRAADLVRAARKFQKKDSVVAKLFAKHFKVEQQVEFLKKSRTGIAVGTPARLMDLLDHGALSVEHLKRIVIDASHIDQKKRGVMDMRETMMPLAKWLTRKEFRERYSHPEKPLELLFF